MLLFYIHYIQAMNGHISPHCDMTIGILGLLFGPVGQFSILRTTSNPSMIRPAKSTN